MNYKRGLASLATAFALAVAGCSAADVASSNISQDSDNFRVQRRVVFINGITDQYLQSGGLTVQEALPWAQRQRDLRRREA